MGTEIEEQNAKIVKALQEDVSTLRTQLAEMAKRSTDGGVQPGNSRKPASHLALAAVFRSHCDPCTVQMEECSLLTLQTQH